MWLRDLCRALSEEEARRTLQSAHRFLTGSATLPGAVESWRSMHDGLVIGSIAASGG
jgi:hypothetical protein